MGALKKILQKIDRWDVLAAAAGTLIGGSYGYLDRPPPAPQAPVAEIADPPYHDDYSCKVAVPGTSQTEYRLVTYDFNRNTASYYPQNEKKKPLKLPISDLPREKIPDARQALRLLPYNCALGVEFTRY